MKNFFANRFFLLTIVSAAAVQLHSTSDDYTFYLKVGSGISVSQLANVVAVYPPWNEALQGYNASLGNCPIADLSIGCQLFDVVDLQVGVSNRSMFTYRKFQTPTSGGESYTREFDLQVTPIMFSANLLGLGIPHCHYDFHCGSLYLIFGAGIGVSNLLITNFRTTGLPPSGDSSPFASFTSENQYTLRQNFTYALLVGVEYSHNDRWAIGTGYRWLNAGNFDGPQYLRAASGAAVDVSPDQWQMRFRTNEWFLELKIFI